MIFIKIGFILLTACLALYGLITKNFEYQDFMFLSLAGMFSMIGIEQFKQQKKIMGYANAAAAVLLVFTVLSMWFIA